MAIDENRDFDLTNFNSKRGKSCPVESDHNPIILDMNISYSKPVKQRIEIYSLKHLESQQVFKEITSKSTMLSKCFTNGNDLKQQVESREKNLTFAISQSFKRIRITDSIKTSESDKLIEKRKNLKNELKTVSDIQTVQMVQNEICSVEKQLSNLLADENVKKIKDNLSMLTETDGSINVSGVWKIKKKIFPKNMKTLPIAKKDVNGRLVSNPEELKTLYIQTYIHRLRHRPVKPGFEELKMLKEELCARRLELVKMKTFQPWCSKDLVKVLQSLKNNKSRDPHSLINEIFKPGVIGLDLQNSLLLMFNRIKEKFEIPEILQFANIISIYKGKNEKTSLENDRGIFIMNIFRSIMMKMVYNDEYETIDSNMSDSNIGARKNKNIRNHLFILNGVINEAIQNKKMCIDIQILDYRQCFDPCGWMNALMTCMKLDWTIPT